MTVLPFPLNWEDVPRFDRAIMFMWSSLGLDTFDIAKRLGQPEFAVANRLAVLLDRKHA